MYGEKHYNKKQNEITDLGDFTNCWTARGGFDNDKGYFMCAQDVIHYILDEYNCTGTYHFSIGGKKYECKISASYTELII